MARAGAGAGAGATTGATAGTVTGAVTTFGMLLRFTTDFLLRLLRVTRVRDLVFDLDFDFVATRDRRLRDLDFRLKRFPIRRVIFRDFRPTLTTPFRITPTPLLRVPTPRDATRATGRVAFPARFATRAVVRTTPL